MIRDEALALRDAQKIAASSTFNDAGFNSFFRRGWKRFYLKWYGPSHPSAKTLCPNHGADRVDPGCACGDVRAAAAGQ